MAENIGSKSRVIVEQQFHGASFSIESGWVAKQASGAVIVRQGETMVLVTVCRADAKPDADFFPLVVDYQEKTYAAGRIPGGYLKREARPAEHEILICRLIDRPIRPLFPDGYLDEIQVICTVLSADGENSPDVLAICGASAALYISEIPFYNAIAGVRVGKVDGKLIINPSLSQLAKSEIDLVIAGTKDAIVMVEGGIDVLPEAEVIEALYYGHSELRKIIELQETLRSKVGKKKMDVAASELTSGLEQKVAELAKTRLCSALSIKDKLERKQAVSTIKEEVALAVQVEFPDAAAEIGSALETLIKKIVRNRVVDESVRIDGRGLKDVRRIECEVGVIPRAHGSALFTRGETQSLVTATLGTAIDAQRMDTLEGLSERKFMFHYNFPPYSTGEVKMLRGTGRRELGHGTLARRALEPVLPSTEDSPYVIRVVSDIMESNGSSSMASVCGGSLALMDAGIAIKEAVAGVAMGLIKEGEKVAVLTDILGDEDHLGDMDFKVCGTRGGITALQMDIKCDGLSREMMESALAQAKAGRLHILGEMDKVLAAARKELSRYAPTIQTMNINPDKIRDVIGPGGKTIRSIVETTGAKIDINDDGTVTIASVDSDSGKRAMEIIKGLTEEAEIGKTYNGVVRRITDFGAFVEILPGCDGLVHISQLSRDRVESVSDVVREGDEIKVKVLDIDKQGRIRLTCKDL